MVPTCKEMSCTWIYHFISINVLLKVALILEKALTKYEFIFSEDFFAIKMDHDKTYSWLLNIHP